MFDLTDVRYVKRIIIGNDNPQNLRSNDEIDAANAVLNRCLHDAPKGVIIGTEKNFAILNVGEHQVVLQWLVYHVGFPRKPAWIQD